MDSVRVIAGCTHRAGLLPIYEQQLGSAGIPLKLEINEKLNYPRGLRMLGEYIDQLSRWLDKWGDCENIVFTDAWDVLFYGSVEDVARKIPSSAVLLGAERNCFPDDYLAGAFKAQGPWKFLNAGLLAAKPKVLGAWLDSLRSHPAYIPEMMDQQWLNHRLLQGEIDADHKTELFYCLFKEAGELQFERGLPVNTINRTHPNFLHFNGKVDSTVTLWKWAMSRQ